MPVVMKIAARFEVKVDDASKLGDGGFGDVFRGTDLGENQKGPERPVAAKRVALSDATNRESFETEREMLKLVHNHASIISLVGDATTDRDGWLFLEMASGGELFDRLMDSGRLSERAAWPYFKALTDAVQHCHSVGVVHRDLKLENVMLDADDPRGIRVIDFGLAVQCKLAEDGSIDKSDARSEAAGTQAYRAPEMNGSPYDPSKVDVWAMGIILFSLCAGFFPLKEANASVDWRFRKLAAAQQAGQGACDAIYAMYKRPCAFSAGLKGMLDKMLTIDPDQRHSISQLANEPWVQKEPAPPPPREGDGVRYRGLSVDDDDDAEMLEPPPDDAPPLERQRAGARQAI